MSVVTSNAEAGVAPRRSAMREVMPIAAGRTVQRLSDTDEARRLRAMLQAVQEHEGALLGMFSVDVCPKDGVRIIVCMPQPEHEPAAATAFAECGLDVEVLVTYRLAQMLRVDHPRIFKKLWPQAIRDAVEAANAGRSPAAESGEEQGDG